MKCVVDTNILFSFFWKNSLTRKLLITSQLKLISPKFALDEIKKYKKDIIKKIKLNEEGFEKYFNELKSIIEFIDKKDYEGFLEKSKNISPDLGDSDFFALCFKNSCFLWSNDKLLKQQNEIKVLSTQEIMGLIF